MFEGCGMDLWNEAEQSGIQKGLNEGILKGRNTSRANDVFALSGSLHAVRRIEENPGQSPSFPLSSSL